MSHEECLVLSKRCHDVQVYRLQPAISAQSARAAVTRAEVCSMFVVSARAVSKADAAWSQLHGLHSGTRLEAPMHSRFWMMLALIPE